MTPDGAVPLATLVLKKKPGERYAFLFDKDKIHTVGIIWGNINGARITPTVYTTFTNLDKLVEVIRAFERS